MKKVFPSLLLFIIAITTFAHGSKNFEVSDIFKSMQPGDKPAILMVHFGTTHDDTRKLTIDAINEKVKQSFPGIELREAYTSRIIIKRLNDKGISKKNPLDALKQLYKEGYTHILIQASTIIDGVEMESLNKNVDEISALFKDIRVGDPLLYSPHDYEKVIDILTKDNDKGTAYVWVGHGTSDVTTAQYTMLDYMLNSKDHTNFFVGCII